MLTIKEAVDSAAGKIGSDTPKLDAEWLLIHVLGKRPAYLHTWPDKELSADVVSAFEELVERRCTGVPVAHLVGSQGFWDLELEVNDSTLIPRPETELIIEAVLERFGNYVYTCVDLGTGTGAIALALAKHRTNWTVLALDRIFGATCLAQRNAGKNSIRNVAVINADWLHAIASDSIDILVSNPPYIEEDDEHLLQGDVRFEPITALASGKDGLDDIRDIVMQSVECLKAEGVLVLEHGYQQAESVQQILRQQAFINIETVQDLAGHSRVTLGRRPKGVGK